MPRFDVLYGLLYIPTVQHETSSWRVSTVYSRGLSIALLCLFVVYLLAVDVRNGCSRCTVVCTERHDMTQNSLAAPLAFH